MIQPNHPTLNILLVEDDPDLSELLSVALGRAGYRVTAVRDARSALQRLALQRFDAVICDIGLPGMRGDELLRHVRNWDKALPFLMLTGETDVPTAVRAVQDGADEYLLKPATPSTVIQGLTVAIESRRKQTERDRAVAAASTAEVKAFLSGVQALVNSLESKDEYTKNHSKKVAHCAVIMANAVPGMTKDALREIRIGALLHDIGKIAVPEQILHKNGPLDEDEWAVIKEHPVHSARIVEPLARAMPEVQRIVRHEHERWDGKGYPDGIAGTDIPLGARLVMIADTYDAICSRRAYRDAQGPEIALKVMKEGAGTQFDPELVPIFEQVYKDFPEHVN